MRRSLALSLLLLAACDDGGPSIDTPAECNPLGGVGCVTPWPSSAYLRDDADSPTGVRLDLAPGSLPRSADQIELDVTPFNRRTGYSPAVQLFTVFPEGVDPSTLVGYDRIADSLGDASPTIVLDLDTGERIAHFAELDANAGVHIDEQALYIRPAARLAPGHHFAVAVTNTLKNADGGELKRPAGFQAILDGAGTSHARLEAIRARTEAAIDALEAAGVPREDLVVAWDFVTSDDESLLADTRATVDAAMAAAGEGAANVAYTVESDAPYPDDANIARRVVFTYDSPIVADRDGLIRDGSGAPTATLGGAPARAVIMIPTCATNANKAGIVIFGHGFFGGIDEAQGGTLRRYARDLCVIVVGGVWRGMSASDLAPAATALNDANSALAFGERILQGIVDFIVLEQLARNKLATELFIDDAAQPISDPARTYFFGISQGSILGTTFFAWDPNLTRAALHVGGANWGVLFERSTNWVTFKTILDSTYPNPIDQVILEQILQMGFDPTDPVHVADRALAGDKHVVLQMSVGDAAVTNLASMLQARTFGLPLVGPALFEPYGLTATEGTLEDAFVIYTEDPTPLPPETNAVNAEENVAHGQLRRRDAVVEQIGHFFETGEIINTCDGACDCAAGACGDLDPP
jgi:hypothetical protein